MASNLLLFFLLVSSAPFLAFSSEPLNPEVEALIAIRQGLVDPHGVLSNWDEDSVDPCSWAMVTCSAHNLVIGLGAPSQGLSGTLSGRIANLTNLEQVLLQNNNITGRLPPELGALPRLQTLDLSNNRFSGRVPDTLGRLSTLRYLRLNNNSLSGAFPSSLAKIPQLSFLDLSYNNLTGPVPHFPTRTFNVVGNPMICGSGSHAGNAGECATVVAPVTVPFPLDSTPSSSSSSSSSESNLLSCRLVFAFLGSIAAWRSWGIGGVNRVHLGVCACMRCACVRRGGSGSGGEVKGWRSLRAVADWSRDKPWRLRACAPRRVLFSLEAQEPAPLPPLGPLLRPRHPREGARRGGWGRRGGGGEAGEREAVRAEGAAGGDGRVQREEHIGEGRVRGRVQGEAVGRHGGGGEAAQGPDRVRGGAVQDGGGDDQPRRAPPPTPPRRILRRRLRRAPPRLPLHAQRQRRLPPSREAAAGLADEEADRGGDGEGLAVPARAVRPEDHPSRREGRERAAGRVPRGCRRRLRAGQAARPRGLPCYHGGARHRGAHRAGVPLDGAVVGEDRRVRLRHPPARARHRPARARGRQGLRRHPAPEGRHARLGEEGAPREAA